MKKKLLTIFLSLLTIVAISQTPQSFLELFNSGEPIPAPIENPSITMNPAVPPPGLMFYTDRTAFDAANPGLPIEGFENGNIAPYSVEDVGFNLDEFTDNAFFSPGDVLPGIQVRVLGTGPLVGLGVGTAGNTSKIVLPNFFYEAEILTFDPPVGAVGFDVHDFTGGTLCRIDIFDASGNLLGSTTSPASSAGVFFGVNSSIPIGEIIIESPSGSGEGVDNIAFGEGIIWQVPVSNWAIIIGLLLIGTFIVIRFRRFV